MEGTKEQLVWDQSLNLESLFVLTPVNTVQTTQIIQRAPQERS